LWAQSLFFLVPFLIVREIRLNTLRAQIASYSSSSRLANFRLASFSDVSFRSETVPSLHTQVESKKSRAVPDLMCSTCSKHRLVASIAADGACSGADPANAGGSAVAFDALRGREFQNIVRNSVRNSVKNSIKPSVEPHSFFEPWWRIEHSQTR
jgi:hypothetical protein